LIEAAEEHSIGLTRSEIAAIYSALPGVGALFIFVAVRRGK
jgi:hypothetical protein